MLRLDLSTVHPRCTAVHIYGILISIVSCQKYVHRKQRFSRNSLIEIPLSWSILAFAVMVNFFMRRLHGQPEASHTQANECRHVAILLTQQGAIFQPEDRILVLLRCLT